MSDSGGASSSVGTMVLNTVSTIAYRGGCLVFGLGAVLATVLYFKQDSMLYFPEIGGIPRRPSQNPRRYRSPSEHQIPFEDHKIQCADGVSIHAWLLLRQAEKNDLPTLVFFHGNAGNIGLRLPNAMQMMQYLNVNILMVEYRGYGESDSVTPNEKGLKLDGQAALKFILKHPKIEPTKVFLFGRSLGGAVAFDLAQYAEQQGLLLAGVIVENTFTSIADMVDQLMPYIAPFKTLVLRIVWNSLDITPALQLPVLFLAGGRDELVPHSHMQQLYKTTTKSRWKQFHVVPEGTHNETWLRGGQEYWGAIRAFLTKAVDTNASVATTADPIAVGGTVLVPATEDSGAASAIPIMPSRLLGIARESIRDSSSPAGKKEL